MDESQSARERDPHTYLLAAAVCEREHLGGARTVMLDLRLAGQRKLHWRDESDKRRRRIIEAVFALPLRHLVVVYGGQPGERPERRRRHCLKRLLYELDQMGVATVTFESRGPADDRRDRDTVATLRASKTITAHLRIEHAAGPTESLLWVPDAICGAITQDRTGNPGFLRAMTDPDQVTVIALGLHR